MPNYNVATSLASMNTSRLPQLHSFATARKATLHRATVAGILAATTLAFTACSAQGNEAANGPANTDSTNAQATAAETTTVTQTKDNKSKTESDNMPNPTGSAPEQGGNTTTEGTDATSSSSSDSDGGSESSGSGASSGLRQDMTAEIYKNPNPGSTFTAGGEQATTCIYGDGYGLNLIAAGPNTSCEFAKAVFNEQTKGLNASEVNIRDHLRSNIKAKSPATGKTYDLSCSTQDDVVVCTGGNNAKIYMF